MLSATSSASSKTPPLSYAERAKKAQNIKTSISAPSPSRIANTSNPPSTSTSSSPAVSPASAARSPSSSTVATSSTVAKHATAPSSPLPSTTPSSAAAGGQPNGVPRPSIDSPSKQPSAQTTQSATPKPPVTNFWNARKEQMAAASRSAAVQSSFASASSNTPGPAKSSPVINPDAPVSTQTSRGSPSVEVTPSTRSEQPAASGAEDPSHRPPVPPSIDSEAWPEVGKSTPSDQQENSSKEAIAKETKEEISAAGRRGEKTKWIPIPAEELQAAADEMLKNSRPQSRKSSRGPNRVSGDQARSGQPHTRNNSGRNSVSHSAAQSRVQSRAGSLQSSPRLPRGRRLPPEDTLSVRPNGTRPSRSPRTGSPSANPTGPVPPTDVYNTYPISPNSSLPPHPYPMYPPHPHVLPPGPTHLPPGVPYPPGSSQDGSPSMPPHAIPQPYPPGYAPYPMYPMYGPYDNPPLYWNGVPPPRSGQHSPLPDPNSMPFYPAAARVNGQRPAEAKSPSMPTNTDAPVPVEPSAQPSTDSTATGEKPVVFGTIDMTVTEIEVGSEETPGTAEPRVEALETSFTRIAIGVSPDEADRRSRTRSNKGRSRSEKDGTEDSAGTTVSGSELPSSKWEFGTTSSLTPATNGEDANIAGARLSPMSGSVSPAQLPLDPALPPTAPVVTQSLDRPADIEADFKVKNFGYGFGQPSAVVAPGPTPTEPMRLEQLARMYEGSRLRGFPDEHALMHPEQQLPHPAPASQNKRRSFNSGERGGRRGGGGGRGSGGFGRGGRSNRRDSFPSGQQPPRQQGQGQPLISITPPPFQPPHMMHVGAGEGPIPAGYYPLPPRPPHIPPYLPLPGYEGFGLPPPGVGVPPPLGVAPHPPPGAPAAPGAPSVTAPVPVPMTTLSFPLDPTRYYLLGQLEYYLSPQNMAQDFFLRQRMDSRGWIHIPLIASFNRIRSLTMDLNLVREVLHLSQMVQVRGDWVRMGRWERFVLPDATPSTLEDSDGLPIVGAETEQIERSISQHLAQQKERQERENAAAAAGGAGATGVAKHGHQEGEEDDEEDDVVFVMGKDS
ncbi:hypothetical protein CC2G_004009 [Coprinopsis cinerea AmutBmut pab1-1]|nr:hypothetical protein CC2G_004009 [Coprinopsis cinerea AmutBmut pab1-1]